MKRILIIGLIMFIIGTALALTIPVLAQGNDDTGDTTADQSAWQRMYEACETGDWDAMAEAAEEVHGDDYSEMHNGNWDGMMGSRWGDSMMGW